MRKTISARTELLWLSLAHAVVDAYALIVPFLLPSLLSTLAPAGRRELFAGVFAALGAAATSLGQVGFAVLSDRAPNRAYLWGGLLVAACGMSIVGLSPSLLVALALVLAGGLGVAAFHPPATVAASRLGRAHSMGVSLFITGGNVGQAVGPLLLIVAYAHWGAGAFVPAAAPGVLLAAALWLFAVGSGPRHGPHDLGGGRFPVRSLAVLYTCVALRTLTIIGFLNFLSLFLRDAGLSDVRRAMVMSGFILFGSLGILLGGALCDRLPRLPLVLLSSLLPAPLFASALYLEGALFLTALFGANFVFQLSTPVFILMGQETMPQRANVATSLMMGAAWGTAGLLNLPVGAIANAHGIRPTLTGLALAPAAAMALLALFPVASPASGGVRDEIGSGSALPR
jgi:FSR family fosmidomycin resistance protein-like MFS transporter